MSAKSVTEAKGVFTPREVSREDYRAMTTLKVILVGIALIAAAGAAYSVYIGFYPSVMGGTLGGLAAVNILLVGHLQRKYRPELPKTAPPPPKPAPPPPPQTVEELLERCKLNDKAAVAKAIVAEIYTHFDLESEHAENHFKANFKITLEMDLRTFVFPDEEEEEEKVYFNLAKEHATIKGPDAELDVKVEVSGHNELRFACEIIQDEEEAHQFEVLQTIADVTMWSSALDRFFGP